jgi:hypothetical protein
MIDANFMALFPVGLYFTVIAGQALTSPNEKEISHGYRWKTIRRECVSAKAGIALG